MKSPLWVLTSVLALLFVCVLFFIIFTQNTLPLRKSLKPQGGSISPIKDVSKVNIARIYENDLFNTFIHFEPHKPEASVLSEVPVPPSPQPSPQLTLIKPSFFAPLDITLKGVIYAYDDKDNRAIISDNKSKNEVLYKIGDRVEDADIIHIGKNKVVFLRSNGQQETVFITAAAAQADSLFVQDTTWSSVINKLDETHYIIDPMNFVTRIANPAQLLDMLDLTTAFDKGRSIGLRVGKMDQRSIGHSLGLQYGDIIKDIHNIPTNSTKQRVEIYHLITQLHIGSSITLKILRNGQDMEISYTLQKINKTPEIAPPFGSYIDIQKEAQPSNEASQGKEHLETIAQRQLPMQNIKLAKRHDRQSMLHGGKNSLLQRMPQ